MPDPRVFRRVRRCLEPTAGGEDVIASVAVDIADARAMANTHVLGAKHMFLKPGRLVGVLEPDQTTARLAGEIIYQHILLAAAGQIADHHSLKPIRLKHSMRLPLDPGPPRILVPPDSLAPH